ncbi:carbohydrate ABC transporter permease [Lacisediminihabitans profunda]|uniref:carbohydrate ABC transporter permease n=1 Tax=Lacisediminihabitans profunda TaxID=2594790 RepID=UPI001C9C9A33|nr:carbohydrate ABC transporter permease [Lacisediminihabitans profunda]
MSRTRTDAGRRTGRAAIGAALLAVILLQLLPFYVALTTALKSRTDLSSQWLLPIGDLFWGNFATAIRDGGILRAIGNSAVVTVAATAIVCVLGALAAYPLARRRTTLNKAVLLGIIGLIMIPPLSILVPLYSMLNRLGAINTYWGIILVMATTQLPLAIFLYSSFMRSLPIAVEEAAVMDGANLLQVLFLVIFPMLKPVTATVVILAGVAIWNDYALSVYVLTDPQVKTIAPAIGAFFSTQSSNLGAAAAASLMGFLPVLVAYLFLQRYFIRGIVAGSER